MPGQVFEHVRDADVVFGVGVSFTATGFGIRFPTKGKTFIHNTIDPMDINKNVQATHALIGDSRLTLLALIEAVTDLIGKPRGRKADVLTRHGGATRSVAEAMGAAVEFRRRATLTLSRDPRSAGNRRRRDTIITHDAGSPRDELSPFWQTTAPHTYIGWGKSTQLGYGLGLAMGAKLARPDNFASMSGATRPSA